MVQTPGRPDLWLFCTRENALIPQLQLQPYAADSAVGEIAIEKTASPRGDHVPCRGVSELRVIQGVQSLDAKFQPLLFGNLEGLGEAQVEIADAACPQSVPAYRGGIDRSRSLNPMDVCRCDAQICVRVGIPGFVAGL